MIRKSEIPLSIVRCGMNMQFLVALIIVFGTALMNISYAQSWGEFIGKVVVEWLPDGRNMKLMESFAYVDPYGQKWNAPAGSVINGASIPQFAWSIIGGPFEGKYREASVIHDVACRNKDRPWQDVHEAFYMAMLASGVDPLKAKVMYAAVYHFGPRWGRIINFSNVPMASVQSKVADVRATAGKDDEVVSEVHPRSPEPGGSSTRSPQQKVADVSVKVVPRPLNLTQKDFEVIRAEIEKKDVPLEVIRMFRSSDHPIK
jgi:hypothetical protein